MTGISQYRFYAPSPGVSVRMLGDGGAVLFDADTGRERAVNATGVFLWVRLGGVRSAADLAAELREYFDRVPSDRVEADLTGFFNHMAGEGLIREFPGPAPAPATGTLPDFPDQNDGPRTLDLSLTGQCNLHCAYCFYHDEMQSRPDLPTDAWLLFFEELKRLAVREVCLSGGEVFVRPDLWELIDAVIYGRMRYSILTNGTLIDDNTLACFEEERRRRRLNSIQVSIDGSRAGVHDRSRGQGSFEKALRGLRLLKEAALPVTVRVTVNRYNVDDLENIARLLLEDIGLGGFTTNDAMPMGAGCENQRTIALTPVQQRTAMETLVRLAERYAGRITAAAGPLARRRMYHEMEQARATGEMPDRWIMGYLTACGCVYDKLSVHHDGVITPCNMLPGLVLGRINRDDLSGIWKTHPTLTALKDRRNIPMSEVPGCGDCEWTAFCNGGCPGLACEMTGDFNRANPHDCYRNFLQLFPDSE